MTPRDAAFVVFGVALGIVLGGPVLANYRTLVRSLISLYHHQQVYIRLVEPAQLNPQQAAADARVDFATRVAKREADKIGGWTRFDKGAE